MVKESSRTAELDSRSLHLRRMIIDSLEFSGRGHVGPALSLVEILRVLYDDFLRFRSNDPAWEERDRLILSKGHGCLALYAVLADKGFIPIDELKTVLQPESRLGGHPESHLIPGVEVSTGSLGHGLAVGVGMALAARIQKRDSKVFVIVGDGELNEGSIWESAMSGAHHELSNLMVIVDNNDMQSYGHLDEVIAPRSIAKKWKEFGFETFETNGHDVYQLRETIATALRSSGPTSIICRTTKGRGISSAENNWEWHFRMGIDTSEIDLMRSELESANHA